MMLSRNRRMSGVVSVASAKRATDAVPPRVSKACEEWKNLYKLSEDTFVEETESLKQGGAGAGLTDND